ncbi:MAG: DUF5666 domain-containing protein [Armatimonadota bacterium]
MFRKMAAVVVVLSLLLAVAASAQVKPVSGNRGAQWWPGEQPGKKAPNAQNSVIEGTVTKVDANYITLQTKLGELAFTVTDETRVMVRGNKAVITDVKTGDPARIEFTLAQDNSRLARAVVISQPRINGKITTLTDKGFTLTNMDTNKTWNIWLTDNTRILSHGYAGTINDLRVGYMAGVQGDENNDSINAKRVEFSPTVIKGVITQVSGDQIQVETLKKVLVTVSVDNATSILIRPRVGANIKGSFSDLKQGMPVNLGGHITGEATLKALWIDVITGGYEGGQSGPVSGADSTTIKRQ